MRNPREKPDLQLLLLRLLVVGAGSWKVAQDGTVWRLAFFAQDGGQSRALLGRLA